jgi:putative aminopeptidase FrvX
MAASILNKASLGFLERYVNNPSPTGFETPGQKLWLDYVKPYLDDWIIDAYGSVAGIIGPEKPFRVVIEAHADEISWFVRYITEDGFIYVSRNGGMDHLIAPSMRVNIHTRKGIRKGVFGWPAIHTRKDHDKEPPPKLESLFLDCGCISKKEVEKLGIEVGNVITYEADFMELNDRYYTGRALDNRIGGFMTSQVARLLKERKVKLPFALYIVNSVQEEIGLRGAQMIAERIKPDAAIVTDVAHDTNTPMIEKKLYGDFKCGNGPILTIGPAVHHKLLDLIVEAAEKNKIPFQRDVAGRSTGTDTDAFAYSNQGVPAALISLPLRYMHTTVESVRKEDVEHTIMLIFHSLQKIKADHDFSYF